MLTKKVITPKQKQNCIYCVYLIVIYIYIYIYVNISRLIHFKNSVTETDIWQNKTQNYYYCIHSDYLDQRYPPCLEIQFDYTNI